MAKVSYYDPVVDAYREVSDVQAQQFIASALQAEAQINANPALTVVNLYDPAIDAFHEVNKASALLFIESAKKIVQ